jgi:DNA-binding transcriptional MerR regulator
MDWTIDELARRVADVLAGDGYAAPNGRVRDVPDARAIRWYATIGLVDRPSSMRGRTARYGDRHLLQLVAIKRRQAEGRSLAEIQAELTGATDETLRRVAGGADPPDVADLPAALETATADETLRRVAGGADPPDLAELPAALETGAHPVLTKQARRHAQFWLERPASPADDPVELLTGVPLKDGAVLLLPAAPGPDDLIAIAAAARPLLDLLAARGLLRSAP